MRTLAWLLIVGGIGLGVVGLGGAVANLAGLYSRTIADPMKDGPEGRQVGNSMLQWVYVGIAGLPVGVAGVWLRGRARLAQRRAAQWPGSAR